VILLKDPDDPKVFWVKRNPKLQFMGGYHAFPGGQLDKSDSELSVEGCEGEQAWMRACAVRELFEETGVLLARGADRLSTSELSSLRSSTEDASQFNAALVEHDLVIDASFLEAAGRWVTPPFAPRRFDTWFFLSWLPNGQDARVVKGELAEGEWIRPAEAYDRWKRGEIIMAPPTLHIIKTLALHSNNIDGLAKALSAVPEAGRGLVIRIELRPGIFMFPLKTPTLPPATHTNCYIVGGEEIIVIDPASPYEEEQKRLDGFLEDLAEEGRRVREIFLTHHHYDHVAGANYLRDRLGVGVAAHRLTAERLSGSVQIDRVVDDDELIEIKGDPGWRLRVLHTPGHTRGHICFYEEITGAILTGDLVVGVGTVVIDPPEGDMLQYFDSLRRLLALPKLSSLFPAHGPVIGFAEPKINEYIVHRTMRENKILDAVRSGCATTSEIVAAAYSDVAPAMHGLAERSTIAHLDKLLAEGRVSRNGSRFGAT